MKNIKEEKEEFGKMAARRFLRAIISCKSVGLFVSDKVNFYRLEDEWIFLGSPRVIRYLVKGEEKRGKVEIIISNGGCLGVSFEGGTGNDLL